MLLSKREWGAVGLLRGALAKQSDGDYATAHTMLTNALLAAPKSGRLLSALGSVQQDLGEYLEAESSYIRALGIFAQSGNDFQRIVVLNNLCTLYLETSQYSKGERVRDQFENLPPEALARQPVSKVAFLELSGSLEHARHRDDRAERYYILALQLLRQTEDSASVLAASIESNLGFLRAESQRYESAKPFFRQAIREIEMAAGPEHPLLIRILVNSAICENKVGNSGEAELLARRAVELAGKIYGDEHPITARVMLEHANTLRTLRRNGEARKLEKRAKASLRNTPEARLGRYTVGLRELAPQTRR
jgi:tetratricopeptide (TPR) repeat protein